MTSPHGPLQGVKVVACSTAQAGTVPYMLMADLGAEVIKIEVPEGGDTSRGTQCLPGFPSTYFETNNRGVKSVTLNLKTAEAQRSCTAWSRGRRSSGRTSGRARRRRTASAMRNCARSIRGWFTSRSPVTAEWSACRSARHGFDGAGVGGNRGGVFDARGSRCGPASCPLRTKPVRSWRSAGRSRR